MSTEEESKTKKEEEFFEQEGKQKGEILRPEADNFGLDLVEMAKAGMHFGQRVSSTHPKMLPYILGIRNAIHIIDLEKTLPKLREALEFIKKLAEEEKILLLVGTKVQLKDIIKETAEACGMPYVTERWLGGTFTNFPVITKRIEYFKELERKRAEGEFERYTKKERMKIDKELRRLQEKFEGIKELSKLPDAVFVCDMKKDHGAVKEARMKNIPVIAICDTNTDPTSVEYPIPANDDAISSVKYILEKVRQAIQLGRAHQVDNG
jgi:small subunit ribosomal protein S2